MVSTGQLNGDLPVSKAPTDPLIDELREAARGAATRSRLGVWMAENVETVADLVSRYGADWPGFAAVLVKHGVMPKPEGWDDPGEAGETARERAGWAVKQAYQRARRKGGQPGQRKPRATKPLQAPAEVRRETGAVQGDGQRRLDAFMQTLKDRSR